MAIAEALIALLWDRKTEPKAPEPTLKIVEGVESTHHYHLRYGDSGRALCDARVMHTAIPLHTWGMKTHLRERYCESCATKTAISASSS